MNMKHRIAMCAGLLFATALSADVITIPVGQQGKGSTLAQPARGISQAAVAAQFGTPLEKKAAVGKPPISSWRYDGFTVYFEGDHVLHSVLNPPAAPAASEIKPATDKP
jgi:outer membrane protein assembly factor BamE (lipoprotein component of BamABCDE complex)